MGLLVAPGAMLPVLKAPPSALAVCVMLSALRQATVWPTFAVDGSGENDWLPFMPLIVIVTSAVTPPPPPPPPGVGDGDVGLLELPQLAAIRVKANRARVPIVSLKERAFIVLTSRGPERARFPIRQLALRQASCRRGSAETAGIGRISPGWADGRVRMP